ncbi:MAG: hypothetical protein GY856_37030, partial [bacterium]|nr:hypothetical protein [bacterium]
DSLRGFKLRGVSKMDKAMLSLLLLSDLETQEDRGVITFSPATSLTEVEVAAEDLAAHQHGQSAPRDMRTKDVNSAFGSLLPAEVQVSYIDPAWDYQDGMRRHRRPTYETDTIKRVRLPIVMTASEAQAIARRMLWTMWSQRQQVEVQLPPSYLTVAEGDVLTFTEGGEERRVLVHKVDRGNNLLIKVEGVIDREHTHDWTASECDSEDPEGGDGDGGVYLPPHITLRVIDLGALSEVHVTIPGFYFSVCATDPNIAFPGGSIYESLDDTDFDAVSSMGGEATTGQTTEELDGGVDADLWDRVNTVNVSLLHGTLASATELKVLNGTNLARIGNEVIGFATATLESDGTYTLSTLLRGLRGTEAQIDAHIGPEPFDLLVLGPNLIFHPVPVGAKGSGRYYKAVASGNVAADYDSFEHGVDAATVIPWAVAGVEFFREVNTDCIISWTRRSRSFVQLFGGAEAPLNDSPEVYAMEIDGETSTRNVAIEAATTYTYTAADQATDWPGGVPSTFTVKIYQVSTAVGFGRVKEATG